MNHVQTADRSERNSAEAPRHDWSRAEAQALYDLPFRRPDLSAPKASIAAISIPMQIEPASLLSIKTGGCPEDCGYCRRARIMTPA